MGVHETVSVIFNDTYTLAIVSGSASEKAARAKVHKLLKQNDKYRNGWVLWKLENDEPDTYNFSISNNFRSVVEQLERAIDATLKSANEEIL